MDLENTTVHITIRCPDCDNTGYIPVKAGQRRCPCHGNGVQKKLPLTELLDIIKKDVKDMLSEERYRKSLRDL